MPKFIFMCLFLISGFTFATNVDNDIGDQTVDQEIEVVKDYDFSNNVHFDHALTIVTIVNHPVGYNRSESVEKQRAVKPIQNDGYVNKTEPKLPDIVQLE